MQLRLRCVHASYSVHKKELQFIPISRKQKDMRMSVNTLRPLIVGGLIKKRGLTIFPEEINGEGVNKWKWVDFVMQCWNKGAVNSWWGNINSFKLCWKDTMILKDTILIHITYSILNRCIWKLKSMLLHFVFVFEWYLSLFRGVFINGNGW